MAGRDLSLQTYDRIIQLLSVNLFHSQCGQVLAQLLSTYCDDSLTDLSERWLCLDGVHAAGGNAVASYLLRIRRTAGVISVSKELALKDQTDFSLICAFLEFTDEPCADELGLNFMQKSDFEMAVLMGAALLKRSTRHEQAVRQLLKQSRKRRFTSSLVSVLANAGPAGQAIAFDWIKSQSGSPEFSRALCFLFASTPSTEMVVYGWEWFLKNEVNVGAGWLLRSILNSSAELPSETLNYAMKWLQGRQADANWLHIVRAVLARAAPKQLKAFGERCLVDCPTEDRGIIILGLVKYSGDPESLNLASEWLKEFARDAQDSLVASMVVALLEKSPNPNPKLLALAKTLLPKVDPEAVVSLLTALLEAGDPDALDTAKQWLETRRIERLWSPVHQCNGRLLKTLLAVAPRDAKVLEIARSWLTREVQSYERTLKFSVQQAYDEALSTS